ncbi:cyclic nucleotide-binding domain-containing protein [Flammeovirga yaeyamensis]|uniref:Cyclic nucleotide-binding domain-containing protein n=1 Tax=Flammeovirga yaeyamensis TaxID=367791 RepID=A0AAX1N3C0_9BACT|nr:cyclic nucleotide-binding domain-containing protein [Flammeovirga yaeyamensis]MBB3700599.1 HEAT repeat protein [Flammeovirga yaeyamensis]NMF37715.1 cyclic nucleotide-binding domain-containing protein [Flammeovirga yaeyamensis]QWG02024.1 cyclic nucleotide-binding domain-containing protein [Flammeovirga yaeyamensis]
MNIITSKIYYYLPEKSIFTKIFQVLSKNNPTWLIFFFAFEGASVAIAFSTAYSFLFSERAVDTLPYIFIFSGLSIMALARVTAYLERRMRQEHLNTFYGVLKILFQLLIWYLSFDRPEFLSIILLVMSVKIIIFLEDSTYWSVSENTFTTSENRTYFEKAKSIKLFSKLAGFIFAIVISKVLSPSSIAFIGVLLSVFSGWSVWQIFTSKNCEEHLKGYHREITRPSRKYTPESFWIFGITNPYIFKIGILTLSISCVWAIIEYFFMIDLRMTVYSPAKGIMVLGLILIIAYAIVSIVQPYFTTRKLQDIGIKKLLHTPPIVLLVVTIITYLLLRLHPTEIPILLSLIAIAFIFTRNIIFTTVQSSILRPIKRKHRGFSYGIIRGFFGASGLFLSGVLLWILDINNSSEESMSIVWLLIGLLLSWWIMAKLVSRDYRVIIRRAFLLRDMESYEIATHDKEVNRLLNSKLMSKMPEDIIYALEANTIINPKKNETIVLHMLRHPDAAIRYFSIEFGENNMTDKIQSAIEHLAKEEIDPLVRKKAIVVTCKYKPDFIKDIIDLIDHKDAEVRKGALYGLLSSKDNDMRDIALNFIKNTIDSDDVFQAMLALEVLAKTSPKDSEPYILNALLSDDKVRVKGAIKITSIVKSPMHIPILISLLKDNKFNDTILRSLINYGEECLNVIENELFVNKRREEIYLITLCKVMGKIKSPKSFEILWQLVEYPWPLMRMAAYNALKRLKYSPESKSDFDLLFKLLERFFSNYYWVCNAIYVLNHEKPVRQLMIKALEDELKLIEEKIRIIQEFLIAGIESQLYTDTSVTEFDRNNSLETLMRNAETEKNLWKSLPPSIYQKLMIVLGYYSLEVKMQKLGDYYTANLVDPLSITLGIIRPFSYNRPLFNTWTKITALISVRDTMSPSLLKFIGQILNKDELRLIEPAAIGLKRILDYQDLPLEKTLDEMVSEEKKELIMGILSEGTKPLLELEKVILLKSTNLFREVPEHVLVDIASITHEIRVPRDKSIFRKGEESREMYIIYEGEVRLHDGVSTYANLINRDFFGDLSILDSSPRTLSATTTKDSVLLRIEQDDFLALMGYRRSLMVGIMKVLGQRIRKNEKSSSFTKEKI